MPLYLERSVSDLGVLARQTLARSSSPAVSSLSLLLAVFQGIFKTSVMAVLVF